MSKASMHDKIARKKTKQNFAKNNKIKYTDEEGMRAEAEQEPIYVSVRSPWQEAIRDER